MLQVTLEISKSNLLILQVRSSLQEQRDVPQTPLHFTVEREQEFRLLVLKNLSP